MYCFNYQKMNSKLKKIAVFLLLITSAAGFGQQLVLSKNARVSVLTCGLGNESYSFFGHTAIRVNDLENQIDVVYNYGAFDFATPNFVAKFTKGDLQYFVVVHSFSDFMSEYQYERRSVYEQELTIPAAYKQQLFDNLNQTLQSDERFYTYKFIDKNCTSMVVDIINKTLNANVIQKTKDTTSTYRSILFPYFEGHFYEKLGTSIIFGKKVDQQGTRLFLPFELLESLKTTTFDQQPIAKKPQLLITYPQEIIHPWWNTIYTYLLVLGLILLVNNRKIEFLYFSILGLLGLFFVFVGFYSFHQELSANYNILVFNPTLLLLLYFWIVKNKKWIFNMAVFNGLCLLFYLGILINKAHLFIVLPLVLTSGVLVLKLAIHNKKKIPIII